MIVVAQFHSHTRWTTIVFIVKSGGGKRSVETRNDPRNRRNILHLMALLGRWRRHGGWWWSDHYHGRATERNLLFIGLVLRVDGAHRTEHPATLIRLTGRSVGRANKIIPVICNLKSASQPGHIHPPLSPPFVCFKLSDYNIITRDPILCSFADYGVWYLNENVA